MNLHRLGDCLCSDPGCPVSHGGSCYEWATCRVFRIDMNDEDGTPMCDDCAADALESGVFCVEDDEDEDMDDEDA